MGDFYDDLSPQAGLRFGDVVTGFHVATPSVDDPVSKTPNPWSIAITRPAYLVVMTPCCSIEDESMVLAPLVSIRPIFLKNEYFEEDLTRINRKVAAEHSVPRETWDKFLPRERKEELIAAGPSYTFLDCFVYDCHDLLKKYMLDRKNPIEAGHYMVDFKSICRVNCQGIKRDKEAPKGTKILQLSVSSRQQLRNKLVTYYARIPSEDNI